MEARRSSDIGLRRGRILPNLPQSQQLDLIATPARASRRLTSREIAAEPPNCESASKSGQELKQSKSLIFRKN